MAIPNKFEVTSAGANQYEWSLWVPSGILFTQSKKFPTVAAALADIANVKAAMPFLANVPVLSPLSPPPPPPATPGQLLASDITLLGHYFLPEGGGVGGTTYGTGLTHRNVNGQERILIGSFSRTTQDNVDIVEFALPSPDAFGTSIIQATHVWSSAQVWSNMSAGIQGHRYGIWWEDQGNGAGRLWTMVGALYPPLGYQQITSSVSVRNLNDDNTVSNVSGVWGFADPLQVSGPGVGLSQRLIFAMDKNPAWFSQQYGVGPYLFGPGGAASLAQAGGELSFGPFLMAGPDPSIFAANSSYPKQGYANDGSDWVIPTSGLTVFADCRSGNLHWQEDWYPQYTGVDYVPPFGRGVKLASHVNYVDAAQGARTAYYNVGNDGSLTLTAESNAFTMTVGHDFKAGDYIYAYGVSPPLQIGADSSGTSGILLSPWFPYPTQTVVDWGWLANPANLRALGAQWTCPAPDGSNPWSQLDSYYQCMKWVDGAAKKGLVCAGSFQKGKAYYPYGQPTSDDSGFELHIYAPADLGAVAQKTKEPWNVRPVSMRDITADLYGFLAKVNGLVPRNTDISAIVGLDFNPATKRLTLLVNGCNVNGQLGAVLLVYAVNC